jgi:hypothetical protein
MSEMYRVARPGGFIVINVAAMEALRGDHSILGHEVRRYSRRTLSALVEDAGFRITRLTYTNAVLFPPLAVVRALQRWRGLAREEHAANDIRVPAAAINWTLAAALRLESLWVRRFDSPFGSSLLCLAQKPPR